MNIEKTKVKTDDGFYLSITEYNTAKKQNLNVIIAPATGVEQKFYKDLALFLKESNFKVITFDFRGIGESKYTPSKNSKATYTNWALNDFKAVFEYSLKDNKTVIIGHSFGALSLSVQERANEALGLYGFGTGSGHHSFMPILEGIKAWLLWNITLPPVVFFKGYMPNSISKMGSDIPKGVYKEWRKWCSMKTFWLEDKNDLKFANRANKLNLPIKIVTASDDPWTSQASAKAYYQNLNKENSIEFKNVQILKSKKVGHTGYFKKVNKEIFWNDLISWLNEKKH